MTQQERIEHTALWTRLGGGWAKALSHRETAPAAFAVVSARYGRILGIPTDQAAALDEAAMLRRLQTLSLSQLRVGLSNMRNDARSALARYTSGAYAQTGRREEGDAMRDVADALGGAAGAALGSMFSGVLEFLKGAWPVVLIVGGGLLWWTSRKGSK